MMNSHKIIQMNIFKRELKTAIRAEIENFTKTAITNDYIKKGLIKRGAKISDDWGKNDKLVIKTLSNLHNGNRQETLVNLKKLKEQCNKELNHYIFDNTDDKSVIITNKGDKLETGASDGVKEMAKRAKDVEIRLKDYIKIAMEIDSIIGYWKLKNVDGVSLYPKNII